jgi:hypothetical protein
MPALAPEEVGAKPRYSMKVCGTTVKKRACVERRRQRRRTSP